MIERKNTLFVLVFFTECKTKSPFFHFHADIYIALVAYEMSIKQYARIDKMLSKNTKL